MSLLGLIFFIVVVGVLMWLLNTYVPMQAPLKTILNVVVVIVVIVVILQVFGLLGVLSQPVPRAR